MSEPGPAATDVDLLIPEPYVPSPVHWVPTAAETEFDGPRPNEQAEGGVECESECPSEHHRDELAPAEFTSYKGCIVGKAQRRCNQLEVVGSNIIEAPDEKRGHGDVHEYWH